MELTDLIMESLIYPTRNVKALLVYIFLSIILGIIAVATGVSAAFIGKSTFDAGIILSIVGLIIIIILMLLINGYSLDIIKIAIRHGDDAPEIDFARQITNGAKYFVTSIVYMIIPIIIIAILSMIFARWIVLVLAVILGIIFTFALAMAECRLAQTEELSYALDIKGALDDIVAIGPTKVVISIVAILLVYLAISIIATGIFSLLGSEMLTSIVSFIVGVYLIFYSNRAFGLLYSER